MNENYDELLDFAVQQARAAGEVMRTYFFDPSSQNVSRKADKTVVTIADKQINDNLIRAVRQSFPQHGVLGEEASYGADASRLWVCDPIDGTEAFITGVPTAMYSLAFVVDGVPRLGVCYEPVQDMLLHAVQGAGAYLNGERVHVSDTSELAGATIGIVSSIQCFLDRLPAYQQLLDQSAGIKIIPGNVFKAALLAQGRLDGYIFPGKSAHDIAANDIIIREAGGVVTDLAGNDQPYDRRIRGAIMSNGKIHDQLVRAVVDFGVDAFEGW
ncbi:hypothetical protein CR970_04010 [Candidatus Saccharibacteria bacterium]|nr:MAG: hypothetical protein CR970_04010 [Candidatus Saccharibacteria bacterium]